MFRCLSALRLGAVVRNQVFARQPLYKNFSCSGILKTSLNPEGVDRTLLKMDQEIRRVGRINRQEIEDILGDIRHMRQATSSQSLMIIRCCGDLVPSETPENRTKLVQEVWKTMESLNVPVDISHYNALLKVYLDNNHKFDPTEFLAELTSKGIEPNRVTFQRLIARYCQDGNIDGASTILQHMKEKQMPINEFVFNSLLHGHAKANDMESAESIITVMTQAGLEPNDDTYAALVCGYAMHGDMENVHRVIKECREKEIFLVDRDYLNLIFTLASQNHDNLVEEVLPYLHKHSGFVQESINVVLRLVNIDKEDLAFRLMQEIPIAIRRDEQQPTGMYFLRQLIKKNKSSEIIIKFCKAMSDSGMNKYALVKACEISLEEEAFSTAFELLEALKETGYPIRQHYFWPFFARAKTEKDIYDGLKYMTYLNVSPNQETLRDYVIPNLGVLTRGKKNLEGIIETLSVYANIPLPYLVPGVVQYLLSKQEMQAAAVFAVRYGLRSLAQPVRRALVEAGFKSQDFKNVVRILSSVGGDDSEATREAVGSFVQEFAESFNGQHSALKLLLEELHQGGVGLSNSAAELLSSTIGETMTPEVNELITKLVSPDLTKRVDILTEMRKEYNEDRTVEELEDMLKAAEKTGRSVKGIQKSLLIKYCSEKDVTKVEKLRKEMEESGFVFGSFLYRNLLDFYCTIDNLEKADEAYNLLVQTELEYALDDTKILKYANLVAKNGQNDRVKKVLEHPRITDRNHSIFISNHWAFKLITESCEKGGIEHGREIAEIIFRLGLAAPSQFVYGALVHAHLGRDDLEGALAEYANAVEKYKVTPCKQELFTLLIKSEDAERLQQVLDLSTKVHGEVNSLYDLVFAFLECGKVRQAKKILDTPGLRARNQKLEYNCQRYLDEDRVQELERLIEVTKDIFDVDRSNLYMYLLKAQCKTDDPSKALSVWTSMQEDSVQPSEEFLKYLATFLKRHNHPVPFVLPGKSESTPESEKKTAKKVLRAKVEPEKIETPKSKLKGLLRKGDLDGAVELTQSDFALINFRDWSDLIDRLVNAGRLDNAEMLMDKLLSAGKYPLSSVTRKFFDCLSKSGEVDKLEKYRETLPQSVAQQGRLNNHIAVAYLTAGRGPEIYNRFKNGEEQLSPFVLTKIFETHEDLLADAEISAIERSDEFASVVNQAVWAHHFQKGNDEKAQKIWTEKLSSLEKVYMGSILSVAREKEDFGTIQKLWNLVGSSSVSPFFKGSVASLWIDLKMKENVQEAVDFFESNLEPVHYSQSSLRRLKTKALKNNVKFEHDIPERRQSKQEDADSTSSDDSDNESDDKKH